MRRQAMLICAGMLAIAATNAVALGPEADEPEGWSWRHGLIGDGASRGDPFSNEPDVPGYLCQACRDVYEYPMDFAAAAFNGFFGEDRWMWESQLGIPFRIYNLQGQWVVVWFEGIFFDSVTLLPDTLDVRVRLPNGQILTFTVLQDGPDLPIGPVGDPDPEPPAGTCGCAGGGEDGDGDYTDPDEGLPEPTDSSGPSGVVSIVDPDENDEFPEWEL